MESERRPSRSDLHLSKEEEAKMEEQARGYFDGVAPKRHTKPQRSEFSTGYVDALSLNGVIPEYIHFQQLENDPQKVLCDGGKVTEEFVETEYYKDLNCVDKQHHTTGTGFITMENSNGRSFNLKPDSAITSHASCKGNPATNDWIPSPADVQW
ncbi:uncharacterized protein LOC120002201 isoform X2 [Tripterygium wilfordii]|uniref:uncharacterized protein LOC120002201 isoform X2 n=1 Tax=Tripterygium wilfordii TaxID=458696 RepID=UPI0018F8282B|nr:uncharacterized protein LOC120002201 isoform X2 [Tripterygium wilfordii]